MKDLINRKVKFREDFRPFAPAVLAEFAHEYFDLLPGGEYVYPYMLATVQAHSHQIEKMPAVVHVDGTARIQTVNHKDNPLFWRVISSYQELSGLPIVLNTSFNIRGEPIVSSIQDAINSLIRSDLDAVFVGDYLVKPK